MKISLIHCYSDHNRGDTGIIASIVDLITEINPDCDISGISTFAHDDIRFKEEHHHTRKTISNMHPSFFPEPGQKSTSDAASIGEKLTKPFRFIISFIKNIIVLISGSKTIAKLIYNKSEYASFKCFIESERVISKGGSFLYSFKGLRGNLFFIRMIFPFYLAKRFSVKIYIFSQSIGPFQNKTADFLFRVIMPKIDGIYLRESSCLKYIRKKSSNIQIISDSAFALNYSNQDLCDDFGETPKIAITARPHKFEDSTKKSNYFDALEALIETALKDGYKVYLVAQVTGPTAGEDDRTVLSKLKSSFPDNENVIYIAKDFSPRELKLIYSRMNLVVGTRLHSTIFSLGALTPSINIAYHGTKSEGIMSRLGMADYMIHIDHITSDELITLFREAILNSAEIIAQLNDKLPAIKGELVSSMKQVITGHLTDTTNTK
ncbi:polysaccharide pyruvyl transferase family protein [Pseudomonas sp. Y24-6]|uniref:polysaccharide pyruvyl transferase family protein n=1 Tax=Pseudomonas sp. Y24-6 TaxID=2750013 RepID=UPI001CE204CB|nr:polysaccharide pyruvyl transferase family protein [Pseudomonas sp. Y24-6]MCA4962038.1 polysaccharide pyruvyl transferase family protein [Pseudomonas sp. Y24-6]